VSPAMPLLLLRRLATTRFVATARDCTIAGCENRISVRADSGTGLPPNPSCGAAAASDYRASIDGDDFEAAARRM
jgi:hypothetical protein